MSVSSIERMHQIRKQTAKLAAALPDVMKHFYGLGKATATTGALDEKTKELMTLAIAVATRCDDCILFHVHAALKSGATEPEILEAIAVAVFMGGGPALMYGTHAMEVLAEALAAEAPLAP